jgi:ATP-dependent exoDNAse (exonuclease V) beta subunit
VERILALIRDRRASLDQIVAITFTEKAAGELKVRLREALEKAGPAGESGDAFSRALEDLERAPISTIHSFCAGLLRERPVEASIDPYFEPLDEIGMDLLFQEAWEQWLGREMERRAPELRRALFLHMDLNGLPRLVRQVYDNRDLLPAGGFPKPAFSILSFIEKSETEIERAWGLTADCRDEGDLGFQSIQDVRGKLRELKEALPDRREALILDLEIRPQGNKQKWRKAASCEAQKQILKTLAGELEILQDSIRAEVIAGVLDWLKGFVAALEEEKARRGVLDFQDLLILARNLLRDDKGTRRYFQERFRYLLVDEFQDTDPLQVEVVFFLAEQGTRAETWDEVAVSPGKLFLVGDPKQSIYRFRRADNEIYEEARAKATAGGGRLDIFQNFRTVPSIISWVNRIFADLIQPSRGGAFQPVYTPLVADPGRKEIVPDKPGVILLAPPPGLDLLEASVQQVREREAESIAALIEELAGEKAGARWMVFDRKEGGPRPVRFRDMALLFPTLSGIEAYEEAFKARSIPYRLEGGKEFYVRQEVRSLLSCLKAVDDPVDGISLVAALRSPFFGFSDEEIFLFASSGNRLNYLHPPRKQGSDFDQAFSLLRGLHETRNSISLSRTVAELLSRTKALEFSLLRQGGEQVAANLRKVLEQARAFEGERQATFRRFVEWLDTREEESVREGESPWSEEGEENVKLLTVHKAKGLEFPVVFLANLASQRSRRQEFIPMRGKGTFQVRLGEFKTVDFEAALEREKEKMEAEDRRLLYVAATRARDHLVVPLFRGRRKGFFEMIEEKLPPLEGMRAWSAVNGQLIAGAGALNLHCGDKPPLRVSPASSADEDQTPLDRRKNWKETLDSVKERASRGLSVLAPSSADLADFRGLFFEGLPELREPGRSVDWTGAALGLAFHSVMERLDLKSGRNLEELCREKTMDTSVAAVAQRLAELCRGCIGHPVMERARSSNRLFREVPFSVAMDDKIVEGKIDLLFREQGGWAIVDYKTDDVSGEALDRRFEAYREQGAWYARAVRHLTGDPVNEVIFFFIRSGEVRTIGANPT